MNEEYWTTKEGKKIAVGDMTEAHAKNTLRMIIRNVREKEEYLVDADDIHWLQS